MLNDVYWQLEYRSGPLRTEAPEGESIRQARLGAVALRITDLLAMPLCRVDIPLGWKPIFYRRAGITLGAGPNTSVVTVFGYGNPAGLDFETSVVLWEWRDGKAVNARPQSFSPQMVALQLS